MFLYFIPHISPRDVTPERIDALGLSYAFEAKPVARGAANGPGDTPGATIAADGVKVGYFPDRQTWRKIPGTAFTTPDGKASPVYVGLETDRPTIPEALARREQLPGHFTTIAGGQWLCPVARQVIDADGEIIVRNALPSLLDVNENGELIIGKPVDRYAHLWPLAMEVADEIANHHTADETESSDAEAMTLGRVHEIAIAALQVNYRISLIEAVMLNLFDTAGANASKINLALIDWPGLEQLSKKKLDSQIAAD